MPRPAIRLMTAQATRASAFCAGRVRARRLRPMRILYRSIATSARERRGPTRLRGRHCAGRRSCDPAPAGPDRAGAWAGPTGFRSAATAVRTPGAASARSQWQSPRGGPAGLVVLSAAVATPRSPRAAPTPSGRPVDARPHRRPPSSRHGSPPSGSCVRPLNLSTRKTYLRHPQPDEGANHLPKQRLRKTLKSRRR